ncbi:MAG: hypothetical protein QOG70_2858, partial [Solirubrobacteraceae bacterium]|nr:hypothetical protein [Solirubrobacteraceae bacterium]
DDLLAGDLDAAPAAAQGGGRR